MIELPEGEEFDEPGETRDIPLTELQDAVPFTVMVPEHLPDSGLGPMSEWAGGGMIQSAIPRPGMPLLVYVSYDLGDRVMLTLRETPEAMPARDRQRLTPRGDMMVGEDRTPHPPRTNVRVERDRTHVELEGAGLSVDELVAIAERLVPLPSGEPPILRVEPS